MVGASGMRLFIVTSVKEGNGVFRLHYANPENYNSSWAEYDATQKWRYPITVLPGLDACSKICGVDQILNPVECSCINFATACPARCDKGFVQMPDCSCSPTKARKSKRSGREN